ncbi:Uncharacterised protein [Providencia stuartii]|nr:Uncharacterised protein [Providencia stuartii]
MRDTGTAIAGIRVARPERRNNNTTNMTNAIAIINARSTSTSEARIVGVLSCATFRSIAAGIISWKSGSSARMRFTVSMILAPASRRMTIKIAGSPPDIPAARTS